MIRTAVFGGSFNPVHYGHINLAKEILRQDLADEVWLMVSPRNPLKQQADLLDEQTRLRLTRLALADVPGVFASDDEFSLPRPSLSGKTLDALRGVFLRLCRVSSPSPSLPCVDRGGRQHTEKHKCDNTL